MSSTIDERLRRVIEIGSYEAWPAGDTPHAPGIRRDGPSLWLSRAKGAESAIQTEQTRGFWRRLAEATGISHKSWNNFFHGQQKATPGMIEGAARIWPQYAFWLATGITDAANGHVAPEGVGTFPEVRMVEDSWTTAYFRNAITLLGEAEKSDLEEIEKAEAEGKRVYGSGKLVSGIRKVAPSDAYKSLIEIWSYREIDRASFLGRLERLESHSHKPTNVDLFYMSKPKE